MTNHQLKMKILRDRPDNLQAAIGIATNEQKSEGKGKHVAYYKSSTRANGS